MNNNTLYTILLWLFFYTLPSASMAQDIRFSHLDVEKGLSHNTVFHMLQDSKGEMLFGTENGFNKFNGYNFTTFYADPADSLAISNDDTGCFTEDDSGYVWIATWGGGLNRFDPHTEHFIHYRHEPNNPKSLPDNRIQAVYYDKQRDGLWVGMFMGGLSFLDFKTQQFTNYKTDSIANRVWAIAKSDIHHIWVATENGLCKFNPKKEIFTRFLLKKEEPTNVKNRIRNIYQASEGTAFVATQDGFYWLDELNQKFIYVDAQKQWNLPPDQAVNCFYEYPRGILWVGTQRNGLIRYNIQTEAFRQYKHDPTDPTSIAGNDIRDVFVDASGVFWVGMRRAGISKFNLQAQKFAHIQYSPDPKSLIKDKHVLSMLEDKQKNIWIGTLLGGLSKIDKEGNATHFEVSSTELNHPEIGALAETKEGKIWIGTEKGLQLYNPKTKQFKLFLHDPTNPESISGNRIRGIYVDKVGQSWIGTKEHGLNLFIPETNTFQRYPNTTRLAYGNVISNIQTAAPGLLWVGTDAGLFQVNIRTKNFTHVPEAGRHSVKDILVTDENIVWLGTPHGLVKYNSGKKESKEYTTKNGLPINQIESLLEDMEGNIWVATTKGLSKLDTQTDKFRNYDTNDGLQSNIFNTRSAFHGKDGKLYFGGINGFNSFYPSYLKDNKHPPAVMITSISKMGKEMEFEKPVDEVKRLELSYKDYLMKIEFAALDYTIPLKNQYAYKLEPLDKDWVNAGNNRSVTYSNLPPGTYTFKVKGSNNDGIWNEEGATLQIVIQPPFWRTTLFYLLAGSLLIGGFTTGFYLRIRGLKKTREKLRFLVTERTKELSDERDKMKEANIRITVQIEEIEAQRDEIEAQRDHIGDKNKSLEKALDEIQWQNREIKSQTKLLEHKSNDLEQAQVLIKEQNRQLKASNIVLEDKVGQRTEELKDAYRDLLKVHKQLDHFTYRSAHDLKGPIARLLGLCYIGQMEVNEAKALEYFTMLQGTAIEMNDLLNRLLQTHEIKTRSISLTTFSIRETIQNIWDEISHKEPDATHIKFELLSAENTIIESDKSFFTIMLGNMLENVIRFYRPRNPESFVRVRVQQTPEGQFAISIKDNGMGVSTEVASKIFDMFVVGTQEAKGTGIGLYEAQVISERLKGKVWLKDFGQYLTEFEIILPSQYETVL